MIGDFISKVSFEMTKPEKSIKNFAAQLSLSLIGKHEKSKEKQNHTTSLI